MNLKNFIKEQQKFLQSIKLTPKEIEGREELIEYLRKKLKNKNFDQPSFKGISNYYDSGINIEVYGSYAAGLSTKSSDLDMRVNDHYTYKELNMV